MLVLSRKAGEEIVLPTCQLTVTILEVNSTRVRLGISAPLATEVYRTEVWRRSREQRGSHPEKSPMLRVLIADSDKYLLARYREHLLEQGFSVATVTGGLDCLQQLRWFAPDVLVLEPDILWGGGDGVLALMHESPDVPRVPVIVLTHGYPNVTLYNIAPFRVDDYQKKPITPRRLAARIRLVLGQECETRSRARQA